jgi:hypothetical protein
VFILSRPSVDNHDRQRSEWVPLMYGSPVEVHDMAGEKWLVRTATGQIGYTCILRFRDLAY